MSKTEKRQFRSMAGRIRGLGSAHEGVHHWWIQRLTALALVPLGLWFMVEMVWHASADYETARAWLAQPVNLILMGLTVLIGLHHGQLGLQVVIEDYVHGKFGKFFMLILLKFSAWVLMAISAVALFRIGFGN